jgi:hypothetical protein
MSGCGRQNISGENTVSDSRISLGKLEIPLPALVLLNFHSQLSQLCIGCNTALHQQSGRKGAPAKAFRKVRGVAAPIPVTGLWTACTRLKRHVLTKAYFSLTLKIEGVKT